MGVRFLATKMILEFKVTGPDNGSFMNADQPLQHHRAAFLASPSPLSTLAPYAHIHTHTGAHRHTGACTHGHMHVQHVHTCMHTYIHSHMHTGTRTRAHARPAGGRRAETMLQVPIMPSPIRPWLCVPAELPEGRVWQEEDASGFLLCDCPGMGAGRGTRLRHPHTVLSENPESPGLLHHP